MTIAIAVPLPPPHTWVLLERASDCPTGHAVILELHATKRRRAIDLAVAPAPAGDAGITRDELRALFALYGRLTAEQRAKLLAYAQRLVEEPAP